MAVIVIRVGTEEKEISGLTKRTTCAEVLEALFKDEQTFYSLNQSNEGLHGKNLNELKKKFVIMEDWRGCEKALSAQTRILAVWRAWGEEQRNVKFLLKKDKGMQFNQGLVGKRDCDCIKNRGQQAQSAYNSNQFISKLTAEQKKRIRRNMIQYQQAILNQQTQIEIDGNNNAAIQFKPNQNKRNSKLLSSRPPIHGASKITLSEEQFVDGVTSFLRKGKTNQTAQNTLENRIYREHCNYRRPHHRHHLPNGLHYHPQNQADTALMNAPKLLYPHRNKSKRRSGPERRNYGNRKEDGLNPTRPMSQSSQNCPDDVTNINPPDSLSQLESHLRVSGDDADDEKSVLTEYGTLFSRETLTSRSTQNPGIDRLGITRLSTSAVTVADSSTTASSDTSNTSSSSLGTTSSDTSASSGEIYDESFFAKRAAAAAAAKTVEVTKSKGTGHLKLFRITKPNLIGSFMKKKKSSLPASAQPVLASSDFLRGKSSLVATTVTDYKPTATYATKRETLSAEKSNTNLSTAQTHKFLQTSLSEEQPLSGTTQSASNNPIEGFDDQIYAQLQKQILSEEQKLKEECNKLNSMTCEIEQLEAQIHKLRAQTHGKNYVQDTYLSGCENDHVKSQKIDKKPRRISSMSEPAQWILDCSDKTMLEDYLRMSERVISTQINIEEHKRQGKILLQEVQDEIWKLSNDPQMPPQTKRVTALALGLEPPEFDDEISEDEDMTTGSNPLSVSVGKHLTGSSAKRLSRRKSNSELELDSLEVKRTRIELEANLSLSLRLASEVDEVEKLVCTSRHLLQSKGETMLDMVRELAQSPEGISADLWDEFGELLIAYDAEMALQQYLTCCANIDNASAAQEQREAFTRENSEAPPSLSEEDTIHYASPADKQLRHSMSQKVRTELREHDPKPMQTETNAVRRHFIFPSPLLTTPAACHSRCRSSSLTTSPLLPMLPAPTFNDSDHEEIPSKSVTAMNSVAPTIISTENAVPIVLRHNKSCPANLQSLTNRVQEKNRFPSRRDSLSTIEDSGNTSGGSTNSDCASTDGGSHNGSCDGESRPSSGIIENQDSAYSSPLFLRDNVKHGESQLRFTYPPKPKPITKSEKLPKLSEITPRKDIYAKPPVPLKSPTVKNASAVLAAENKRRLLILHNENRPKKLIRRNSAQPERSTGQEQCFRRVSSFGKSGISPLDLWKQSQNPVKPLVRSKEHFPLIQKKDSTINENNLKTRCHKHFAALNLSSVDKSNPRQVFKANAVQSRDSLQKVNISIADSNNKNPYFRSSTSTYENDSDTGRSSLHSTDSFDRLNMYAGETLV